MAKPKLFLQIVVLLGFAGLLSSFVAYRAGAFDDYLLPEANSDATAIDSPTRTVDSVVPAANMPIMHSTKSAYIFDPAVLDSPPPSTSVSDSSLLDIYNNKGNINKIELNTRPERIHSTKSAPIFEPYPIQNSNDTEEADSIQN